ncbi:MAG: pyruvate ferredoxin oxidoreductase [Candidatus Bathyarchaeia archaeon]
MIVGLTGNEAVAQAVKQCNVDLVAAYPITPSTVVVEKISEYVANGEINTEFICVESEHSAMSACIGASLAGARVFTATSSQGLAYMHEMLYITSGLRCPVVMSVANRALSAPINIHCDHSDAFGSRDCGWIQLWAEDVQETYDCIFEAFRIAESPEVTLPTMVCYDGFIISHALERVNLLSDDDVKRFLPGREAAYTLNPKKPITVGALVLPDYYFEIKRQQEEALRASIATIRTTKEEFKKVSGREHAIIQSYMMEDAESAVICLGSTAGQARVAVDELRKEGKKVGVLKLHLYRPFPAREVVKALRGLKVLAVLDRAYSPGAVGGPLFSDVCAAMYGIRDGPYIFDVAYGLGGRDISTADFRKIFDKSFDVLRAGRVDEPLIQVGVRE